MKATVQFITAMVIFGTIGIVVRQIELASSERALLSSAIASVFLFGLLTCMKRRIQWHALRKNGKLLVFSSMALSLNWIFLYASYDYTSIANATLGYYFAPVFVVLLAPIVLKEPLAKKKVVCIGFAIVGLVLIVFDGVQASHTTDVFGISFGVTAALFYASLVILNRFVRDVDKLEWTIVQLGLSALLLLPYVFITEGFGIFSMPSTSIPYMLLLGVGNTALGFWLFFASMKEMSGQRMAMLSYIDPFVAIFISAYMLREPMTPLQMIGGVLSLGATLMSEISITRIIRRRKMT